MADVSKLKLGSTTYDIKSKTGTATTALYGTCATAAATAAKEVIIADPTITRTDLLQIGTLLSVKFTNANTVANPTLTCFNNSGTAASPTKGSTTLMAAKSIKRYGTTAPSTSAASSWNAGSVVTLVYDGSYWQMIGWINNNDNTVPSVYCGTAAATAAKGGTLTNASWSGLTGNRYLQVSMYYDNTAASALTLNVCSQGAKPIYINGTASSATNYTLPRGTYIVYYDGTNFYFRTDGKIPKLIDSGSLTTSSIGSASAGTAIAADDITAWTTNTPTAVTKKTVVTSASGATAAVANCVLTITDGSFSTGDSVSVTEGTSASLSYTARSIPNISVTSTTVVTGDVD